MKRIRMAAIMCAVLICLSQLYILNNSAKKQIGKDSTIDTDKLTPLSVDFPSQTKQIKSLHAKEALLMDGETGRVLYEKDGYTRAAMASTTKIMTAIYVIENCDLNDIATTSANAAKQPKVHLGAQKGEQYKVQDLLFALMLESYNDCAVILAEHVSGSVDQFCQAMTEKAQELGCKDTSFETPNGLDASNHYTTPYDLARITKYALENETFSAIVRTKEYSFTEVNGKRQVSVYNKDGFLDRYNGAVGVKTGFTGNAGYCFVGAVKHDGKYLISVVLASGWPPNKTYKWEDTIALMEYGEANFVKSIVIKKQDRVGQIQVDRGAENTVPLSMEGSHEILLSDQDKIETRLHMKKELQAPVKKGQKVGSLSIYVNDTCYDVLDIRTTKATVKEGMDAVIQRVVSEYTFTSMKE